MCFFNFIILCFLQLRFVSHTEQYDANSGEIAEKFVAYLLKQNSSSDLAPHERLCMCSWWTRLRQSCIQELGVSPFTWGFASTMDQILYGKTIHTATVLTTILDSIRRFSTDGAFAFVFGQPFTYLVSDSYSTTPTRQLLTSCEVIGLRHSGGERRTLKFELGRDLSTMHQYTHQVSSS